MSSNQIGFSFSSSTSGGGGDFGMTISEAVGEKADMQALNSRFAEYIQKIRSMKSSGGTSSSAYMETMRQLEAEVTRFKTIYEAEISRLRCKVVELTKKNIHLEAEIEKSSTMSAKCMELGFKIKKLEDQCAGYRLQIDAAGRAEAALREKLCLMEREAGAGAKGARELEGLRIELAAEIKKRQMAEACAKNHDDKTNFDQRKYIQQIRELEERLRAKMEIIMMLEKRIKAVSKGDGNLPGQLMKLREHNNAEMKRFQRETEAVLARNMGALKLQMEEAGKYKAAASAEMHGMQATLKTTMARCQELEAQKRGMEGAYAALQAELERERAMSAKSIAGLEAKLQGFQQMLVSHSKQFVNAREAQASLRQEIDTYNILLEQERRRLSSRSSVRTPIQMTMKASFNSQTMGGPRGMSRAGSRTSSRSSARSGGSLLNERIERAADMWNSNQYSNKGFRSARRQ